MLNGDLFGIYDNLDDFKIPHNHVPRDMKKASKLCDHLYWKELKVAHLLDVMHVFKDVANSLWKHIYFTEKYVKASIRDLAMSKKKQYLQEKETTNANEQNNHLVVSWILSKDDLDLVKKVLCTIRMSTRHGSSLEKKTFTFDG
jgi:hypothetical protein